MVVVLRVERVVRVVRRSLWGFSRLCLLDRMGLVLEGNEDLLVNGCALRTQVFYFTPFRLFELLIFSLFLLSSLFLFFLEILLRRCPTVNPDGRSGLGEEITEGVRG